MYMTHLWGCYEDSCVGKQSGGCKGQAIAGSYNDYGTLNIIRRNSPFPMPASQTREKGKDISVTRMETRTHFKTLIIERPERGKIHVSLPSLPKLSSVGY